MLTAPLPTPTRLTTAIPAPRLLDGVLPDVEIAAVEPLLAEIDQ
jgi:hypothetical protein